MQVDILPGVLDTLKHFNTTKPHLCQGMGAAGEGPGIQTQQRSWATLQCNCRNEEGGHMTVSVSLAENERTFPCTVSFPYAQDPYRDIF